MKILKPGQQVTLHEGTKGEASTAVIGTVRQVCIHVDLSIQYQIGWWNDRTHQTVWLCAEELHEADDAAYLNLEPLSVKPA